MLVKVLSRGVGFKALGLLDKKQVVRKEAWSWGNFGWEEKDSLSRTAVWDAERGDTWGCRTQLELWVRRPGLVVLFSASRGRTSYPVPHSLTSPRLLSQLSSAATWPLRLTALGLHHSQPQEMVWWMTMSRHDTGYYHSIWCCQAAWHNIQNTQRNQTVLRPPGATPGTIYYTTQVLIRRSEITVATE